MKMYDAEMVEMIMMARPEYFIPKNNEIKVYENAEFWQIEHTKKVTGSIAEDVLDTATSIELKYGRMKAISYIKNVMKKGA